MIISATNTTPNFKTVLGITQEELKKALELIGKLNPKPGGALSSTIQNTHVVPDFILTLEDGRIEVKLNRRNAPQLKVSNAYKDMLEGYQEGNKKSKTQQDAVQFIKQKLDAAKWFIDAIQQRHQTLNTNDKCNCCSSKRIFFKW